MGLPRDIAAISTAPTRSAVHDCWSKIGVYGNASCEALEQHVHCRNCPVYSAAAADLLDSELPADYLGHWTAQIARQQARTELDTHSVLVFRIGAEWLALPTGMLQEIVDLRAIHSLPHRRNGIVLGLANVRGELLICISLQQILGLEQAAAVTQDRQRVAGRLLVLQSEGGRAVCPVDEVIGLAYFHPRELAPVPATIGRAAATYTRSLLPWQKKSVGLLDEQLLMHTINRSLA